MQSLANWNTLSHLITDCLDGTFKLLPISTGVLAVAMN